MTNANATKREYQYALLDVFTKERFKGNPLAVVLDAERLTDLEMQQIAAEFNLSETVFLFKPSSSNAAAKARIFTPRRELPFAGHPTIGSASVIASTTPVGETFFIEEQAGDVKIDVEINGSRENLFWFTNPPVQFFESLDRKFCADLLGLNADDVLSDVPPTFVSAGTPLLFIALQSVDAVDRAELQRQHLARALGSVDSAGTFIFARKHAHSHVDFDVYARMFQPQAGTAEDPATGGATGPLAAYMMKYAFLPNNVCVDFTSEQGTKMGRQSFLYVRTDPVRQTIQVGGTAVNVGRGVLELSSP